MKPIITLTLIITSLSSAWCQNFHPHSLEVDETDSLYMLSIEAYIEFLEQENRRGKTKTIYIKERSHTSALPYQIKGNEIVKINSDNYKKHLKKNGNSMYVITVRPLRLSEGVFYITLEPSYHRRKGIFRKSITRHSKFLVLFKYNQEHLELYDTKAY